jgi:uncharacterized damage-inducible protein DinB
MTLPRRLQQMRRVRERIIERVAAAPVTHIHISPFGYEWTVGHVLHHLIASEQHFLAELARNLPAKEPEPVIGFDALRAQDARETLVACLLMQRAASCVLLAELSDAALARPIAISSHPLLVGRSGFELLDFMTVHEDRHGQEIDEILARAAALGA